MREVHWPQAFPQESREPLHMQTRTSASAMLASAVSLLALLSPLAPALAQGTSGAPGSPGATTTIDGKQLPPPPQKFGGKIERDDEGLQALVAGARRAAEGRAERAAHHHRRRRLRRALHVRRRHPHAGARPDRGGRPALHQLPLHGAVLADARRPDHRAQPPLGRVRRHLRAGHRLPGLRQLHQPRTRPPSARS